jgi:hypothetical protein
VTEIKQERPPVFMELFRNARKKSESVHFENGKPWSSPGVFRNPTAAEHVLLKCFVYRFQDAKKGKMLAGDVRLRFVLQNHAMKYCEAL